MASHEETAARRARRADLVGRFMLDRGFHIEGLGRMCETFGDDDVWLFDDAVLKQDGWRFVQNKWHPPKEEVVDPLPPVPRPELP